MLVNRRGGPRRTEGWEWRLSVVRPIGEGDVRSGPTDSSERSRATRWFPEHEMQLRDGGSSTYPELLERGNGRKGCPSQQVAGHTFRVGGVTCSRGERHRILHLRLEAGPPVQFGDLALGRR